jgi:cell division protein FtsB
MKTFLIYLAMIVVIILLGIGLWFLKRNVNYKLGYESMVQEQIQKEVKILNARIDALEKQIKLGK